MALARPSPRWLARTRAFTGQMRAYSAPGEGTIPASKKKYIPTSGTYPLGFKAGSAHVGVRFAVLKVGREMFEEGTGIGEERRGTAYLSTEWVPGESRPE